MISIHQEVTIDLGTMDEQSITLWLVSYGSRSKKAERVYWPMVAEALRSFCARQGWLLECGDDPHREKSLPLFSQGFFWPPDSDGSEFDDEFEAEDWED